MTDNRSVVNRRRDRYGPDALDFFPTPPWAARALAEMLQAEMPEIEHYIAWDPAVGQGHMLTGLADYFAHTVGSDVHDWLLAGWGGFNALDFLCPKEEMSDFRRQWFPTGVDWIITNPPFALAEQFITRSNGIAQRGVAMLVRTSFLEGKARYDALWRDNPPTYVAFHVERVPMVKGRLDPKASTATSYCWLVWIKGASPRPVRWIAPCRKRLERASDYEPRVKPDDASTPMGL